MSARLGTGDLPNDPAKGRPDWCICERDWYARGLLDPRCRHDDMSDLARENAALREHPKAYQIDGGSVHTVITTAQYEALRKVVDADIAQEDAYRALWRWNGAPDQEPYAEYSGRCSAADDLRREALAAYRAEWR